MVSNSFIGVTWDPVGFNDTECLFQPFRRCRNAAAAPKAVIPRTYAVHMVNSEGSPSPSGYGQAAKRPGWGSQDQSKRRVICLVAAHPKARRPGPPRPARCALRASRGPSPEGEGEDQTACKPGSVRPLPSRRAGVTVIPLDRPLPTGSRDLPGPLGRRRPCRIAPTRDPYSVLLLAGLAMRPLSPAARWALTPPFHPYLPRSEGGLLSVALSLGSPPVGVTHRHVVVEPGLSSTPEDAATARPSDPRGNWSRRAVRSTTSPWRGRPRPCRPSAARGS